MVEASPGKPALIYVGYDHDGEVLCSYTALNTTGDDSEVEIDTEEGGKLIRGPQKIHFCHRFPHLFVNNILCLFNRFRILCGVVQLTTYHIW